MSKVLYKRSLKNYFLKPMMQTKLGLYFILASILFAGSIIVYGYTNLAGLYDIIVELTDISDELSDVIRAKISSILMFSSILGFFYVLFTVLMSVYYTHRFVGPMVAFKRHIDNLRKGDFSSRVVLRKSDAFSDLAEELNMLAGDLEKSKYRKPNTEAS